MNLKDTIRDIPDFPKPGIMFRDITPLLASPEAFGYVIDQMAEHYAGKGIKAILAAEARGFIFAAPLALKLGASFVPIRKPGKLPYEKLSFNYDLEYGSDCLEMHVDAFEKGDKVLIVDDLLATGGTIKACIDMAEQSGADIVGVAFLIELTFLQGRKHLEGHDILSLIKYDSES